MNKLLKIIGLIFTYPIIGDESFVRGNNCRCVSYSYDGYDECYSCRKLRHLTSNSTKSRNFLKEFKAILSS